MLAEILHKIKEMDQDTFFKYSPRPSLAGPQRCIRSLDYMAQGFPPAPFPGRALQVMDDSSWHEELIKEEVRKSAYRLHSEQMHINVPVGLPLRERKCLVKINGRECGQTIKVGCASGHIDGIFTDMLQVDRVLEIKALSHFGFIAIKEGELPLDYIYQTAHYLEGVQEVNPEINEALLFIKNKNQAQYLDILLRYDKQKDLLIASKMTLSTGEVTDLNFEFEGILTNSRARFQEIDQYKKEGKLHNRQYTFDDWHCEYCRWGAKCWEGWEEEIQAVPDTLNLDDDIGFLVDCENLINLKAAGKNVEEQVEKIEDRLKTAIQGKARHGKAGSYIWGLRPQFRSNLNKEKIAPEVVAAATEKKMILIFESPKTLKEPQKAKKNNE
jgi:hypothetical protein